MLVGDALVRQLVGDGGDDARPAGSRALTTPMPAMPRSADMRAVGGDDQRRGEHAAVLER